ncbi:MAG: UDP-N-acetylmuramoyl-L-alanine--D-glutamate ligase [Anaerolineales bacterium]
MAVHWKGKRVIVIGAARQGLALARYLARHGAHVTLNDRRAPEALQEEMAALAKFKIEWVTGGHPLSILEPRPDLVCVSGGVPLSNPIVAAAQKEGLRLSNDTQIFMEAVPGRSIGITGSAGKTTTTTLVGRIAQRGSSGIYGRVWLGGNIGDPLINYVDEMQPTDLSILEISSFQAELMRSSPNVAAILNITPNHLDRHGSMAQYIAAKRRIINYQRPEDFTVLGRDDPEAWNLADQVRANLLSFGFSRLPQGSSGSYADEEGRFFLRQRGEVIRLPVEDVIELRGDHNRLNVLAACAIAHAAGFSPEEMREGIKNFRGVPHRIEFVRSWRGAQWYNDSIATAPERTLAAIRSFSGPLILLLGGRDKDLPWEELAKVIHQRVDHVVLFGEAAGKIEAALGARLPGQRPFSQMRVEKLREAVSAAARLAQPGYVVLLSPGGTSYDEFKDFEERGERFKEWVNEFSETLR